MDVYIDVYIIYMYIYSGYIYIYIYIYSNKIYIYIYIYIYSGNNMYTNNNDNRWGKKNTHGVASVSRID